MSNYETKSPNKRITSLWKYKFPLVCGFLGVILFYGLIYVTNILQKVLEFGTGDKKET